jgi:hypothetical protein
VSDDEPLETGYGPAAPPGDNLCNDFQQETARSYAELARARGARIDCVDGVLTMTDAGLGLPFWNRTIVEQPSLDIEQTVARVKAFYDGNGHSPYLFDSAGPTADLRGHGFVLMGHPPLMVRPAGAPLPGPPPELRIVRVEGGDTAADLERTLVDGYPAPQFQPFEKVQLFTPPTFGAAGWHHFVGYVGDRPVAAGSSYVGDRLLRVENIATLSDVRGKGYGIAITAATIAADPSKPATLIASDLGRPVYERLGFVAMLRVTYWLGMR